MKSLVAAAGVGTIILTQKQVAAGLVTGVLYCMANIKFLTRYIDVKSVSTMVAGIGVITMTQKQVAAGMVTSVMYCMASKYDKSMF